MGDKLSKFFGKPVEVKIGGEAYSLMPFKVSDLPLLDKLGSQDKEEQRKALSDCVLKLAKQIDSDCTETDVQNFSLDILNDFAEAIAKVNSVELDEAKKALLERMNAVENAKQQ